MKCGETLNFGCYVILNSEFSSFGSIALHSNTELWFNRYESPKLFWQFYVFNPCPLIRETAKKTQLHSVH